MLIEMEYLLKNPSTYGFGGNILHYHYANNSKTSLNHFGADLIFDKYVKLVTIIHIHINRIMI